jgi:hypothetical protein
VSPGVLRIGVLSLADHVAIADGVIASVTFDITTSAQKHALFLGNTATASDPLAHAVAVRGKRGIINVNAKRFDDVPEGQWAENYIAAISNNAIASGCGHALYCPEDYVTRDQMAVFVIKAMVAEGLLEDNFTYDTIPYFGDVPSEHWAFRFVQKMSELGITSGCSQTTYCPGDYVTRAQMAVFIVRALTRGSFIYGTFPYFSDVTPDHFAFQYVQRLFADGTTSGCRVDDPGTQKNEAMYCHDTAVTRSEMAVFLTRGFLQ